MAEPRFTGEQLPIGGTDHTVPPIAMRPLIRLLPKIDRLNVAEDGSPEATEEQLDITYDLIHAAVSRNYPELSRADLDVMITPGELPALLESVMRQSGLKRVTEKND